MTAEVQAAESQALLSGRRARWAMFLLSELAAVAGVLMMLQDWHQVKAPLFVGALILASVGPALNLLVPQSMRDEYARQMAEIVAQRNDLLSQVRASRDLLPASEPKP